MAVDLLTLVGKRLLVVGGTGFIGHNLCASSLRHGLKVTSLSLSGTTPYLLKDVQYLSCDVRDLSELSSTLGSHQFDYVVNTSGYINHSRLCSGGSTVLRDHVLGTINLITSLDKKSLIRFVNLGSSDEYGQTPSPLTESSNTEPRSLYSLSKSLSSQILSYLNDHEAISSVTLRLFLVYGPFQNTERFLPSLIRSCLTNTPFHMTDGQQIRDYCFVDDICLGILSTLAARQISSPIFNLGSGTPVSIHEVATTVQSIIGSGDVHFGSISTRPGESKALYPDISRAMDHLGWIPQTSLHSGLSQTIDWYRTNQ